MIILVMGLPGSGKSYFARRFAQEIGAAYVSSDETRKKMGLMGKYNLENKLSVYLKMMDIAERLHKKQDVVLDATFYLQTFRDLVLDFCKRHACKYYMIMVRADKSLVEKRLSKPREDSEADLAVHVKIKSEFEPLMESHLRLRSTDGDINENLKKAVEYLRDINDQ